MDPRLHVLYSRGEDDLIGDRDSDPARAKGPASTALVCAVAALWAVGALPLACRQKKPAMSDEQKRERIEALYEKYRRKFPEVEGVSVSELAQLRQGGRELVMVDVRQPEEQAVSMIPGAIRSSEFEDRREEFDGALVVTYCTAGYRSGLYAQKLLSEGWDAVNLEGSLLAWTHAGQPLVDARGPTRRVHVYGPEWNLAASGYEPVW